MKFARLVFAVTVMVCMSALQYTLYNKHCTMKVLEASPSVFGRDRVCLELFGPVLIMVHALAGSRRTSFVAAHQLNTACCISLCITYRVHVPHSYTGKRTRLVNDSFTRGSSYTRLVRAITRLVLLSKLV